MRSPDDASERHRLPSEDPVRRRSSSALRATVVSAALECGLRPGQINFTKEKHAKDAYCAANLVCSC